MTEICRTFSD